MGKTLGTAHVSIVVKDRSSFDIGIEHGPPFADLRCYEITWSHACNSHRISLISETLVGLA